LALFGRTGGVLLGVATVLAVAERARWRLIVSLPVGVVFAAVTGWPTTGILACVYVSSSTCRCNTGLLDRA